MAEPTAPEILALLEQRAPRPLAIEEIAKSLSLARYDRKAFKAVLEREVQKGVLRRIGKTRYQWLRPDLRKSPPAQEERRSRKGWDVEGIYTRTRQGYGFVEVLKPPPKQGARDVLIPQGQEGGALHEDHVQVEITRQDERTGRMVGRIVRVTRRCHEKLIGALEQIPGGWRIVPENQLLPALRLVGGKMPERAQAGLIATAVVTKVGKGSETAEGELFQVLGKADDPDVQFETIALEHGLRVAFPPEVDAEASALPHDPAEKDYANRQDLRRYPFVTIDGETARDFDDAVCLEEFPDGGKRLFVAIADVSHYVRPGNALNEEAVIRGTSVYFPDRAVPMLPERLSAELCSLMPQRDRLVLVAEMLYGSDGRRGKCKFYRAVIKSHARLTYTKVAAMLSEAQTDPIRALREEYAALLPMLEKMRAFMRSLYLARVAAGSLDLDLPETLLDLSNEGKAVGLRLSERNDAHRMVEEFMLEANQAVAIYLEDLKVPLPYRIHEQPDIAKIEALNTFLEPFGLCVDHGAQVRPIDLQRFLEKLEGHRLSRVIARLVLRSLKQARYSTENMGHFGLAFTCYCHFTSPIRRYPDLLVHRQLGLVFDGRVEEARRAKDALEALCLQNSESERSALQAERDMIDLKKAEFMLKHLLEPEEGTVTAVTPFGFFVELDPYPVEGLVRVETLGEERFFYNDEEQSLVGQRSGLRFGIGDRVVVECTDASLSRRQMDFSLLKRLIPALPPGKGQRHSKGPARPGMGRKAPEKRQGGKPKHHKHPKDGKGKKKGR